uniref:Transmembrane protein 244 n=1 Tax=Oncorhynchus mykiss TaxID=8022 RepID=A0A8L0DNW7_ONCMY
MLFSDGLHCNISVAQSHTLFSTSEERQMQTMRWPSGVKWPTRGLDHFDGLIPFDFKTEPTNLESNSKYLVNLLSMELTYFCSGLLFAAVVRRWVWDYALTVTLLHVLLTSMVMLEFPLVWQWWLALGSGLFLMICNGQLIAYFTCQSDQSYPTFNSY